ncbi:hypothetical protein [Jeotgalibacillus sp. R-1-5s-1]|uniref:hypothetical protein n=1 Tax=Jeotgalibacillus sp. R-1-5s-1 TaxID=2555897 RepID=UPI00106C8499|nr:hypothetical protein [Jeotgalibacillus sp. R-1-5s-1]TFD95769.1 hypothetical protein E2491_11345 [Jeotgalibacillus sp. R-1-5s-1]
MEEWRVVVRGDIYVDRTLFSVTSRSVIVDPDSSKGGMVVTACISVNREPFSVDSGSKYDVMLVRFVVRTLVCSRVNQMVIQITKNRHFSGFFKCKVDL